MNHAFHNGNKRTALVSLIALLDANNYVLPISQDELFQFVLNVVNHRFAPAARLAASESTDAEVMSIAVWIRNRMRRVQRYERALDFKELRKLLEARGCEIGQAKSGFIEITREALRTHIAYYGENREVRQNTVHKIRQDLELDDVAGVDAEIFYAQQPKLDAFINRYRTVLQRLARV
jgi:death-on-curing protein